jgi:pimeloyl-ACP methyl ester carboxylesterase
MSTPALDLVGDLTVLTQRPASPRRSPILFVHGYLATASTFDRFLPWFAARGHPAHAVNLRGREGSRPGTAIGRVRVVDYVTDASAVARTVAGESGPPIVVGHSLGGLVAQKLAERGEASAVVLLSAAPPRGIPLLTPRLVATMTRYLPALLGSRPLVPRRADFEPLVMNRVPPAERDALFPRFVPDSGRVGRELATLGVAVDRRAVRCPVLVVTGDDDRFVPARIAHKLAARYDAPLHVAPGHAHLIPQEPGWERVAETIAAWIDALPGG